MCLLPRGVKGNGPRRSVPIQSRGAPTCILPSGALAFLWAPLLLAPLSGPLSGGTWISEFPSFGARAFLSDLVVTQILPPNKSVFLEHFLQGPHGE